MITCKDCKFWKRKKMKYGIDITGYCRSSKIIYNYTDRIPIITDTADLLIYSKDGGYSSNLETMQNFGCIHGVKK